MPQHKFLIEIPRPDDWHVHLRDTRMLEAVRAFTEVQFQHYLLMPNLIPPLDTAQQIAFYRERVAGTGFEDSVLRKRALFTFYLTRHTYWQEIEAASPFIRAAKFYPDGGTTNSGSGLKSPRDINPDVLRAMEDFGNVLCLHGEVTADVQPDPLLREVEFIPHLAWLVSRYPRLKIVVEHVSDRRMLDAVYDMPENVAATITGHHPFITNFDAVRDIHCNCMPVAKTGDDRDALAEAILTADTQPKIFFGSDSAPHTEQGKHAGFAGVWSSPVAIPVLWDHFMSRGGLQSWDAFAAFTSTNGARFYGVGDELSERPVLTLVRQDWRVPEEWLIDGPRSEPTPDNRLIPWKAGEVLPWRVLELDWFGEAA